MFQISQTVHQLIGIAVDDQTDVLNGVKAQHT